MDELPDPPDLPVGALVRALADRIGEGAVVDRCVALLDGAPREEHLDVLPWLTGLDFGAGAPTLDRDSWKDFWPRSWGARGLLYVWAESAGPSVVAGLALPPQTPEPAGWRVAEMCLKVVARREVAGAGDPAAALAGHELSRVRGQAMRALAVVGDTEHVPVVRAACADPDPAVRRRAAAAWERMAQRLDLPEEPDERDGAW